MQSAPRSGGAILQVSSWAPPNVCSPHHETLNQTVIHPVYICSLSVIVQLLKLFQPTIHLDEWICLFTDTLHQWEIYCSHLAPNVLQRQGHSWPPVSCPFMARCCCLTPQQPDRKPGTLRAVRPQLRVSVYFPKGGI